MFFGLKKQLFLLIAFLLVGVSVAAEDVPLPKQSAYTGEGLAMGLAVGVFNPSGEECNCIGMWQAHVDYFYLPYLSGGLDIRIYGGDIDSRSMILYQRYQMHVRFYKNLLQNLVVFGAPLIGFETTDLQAITKNIATGDPTSVNLDQDICTESFALNGFSMGAEFGAGYKMNKDFGLLGGALYEFNFSDFHYVALSLGVAFNIRNHSQRLTEGMFSSWISFEVQWQRYIGEGDGSWSETFLLGLFFGV
jgi:hypothetical protein